MELRAETTFTYPARITRARGEIGYLVTFPDLPGCITEGDTLEEALANAREALSAWLGAALDHGDDVPQPTSQRGRTIHPVTPDLDVVVGLALRHQRDRLALDVPRMARKLNLSISAYRELEGARSKAAPSMLATLLQTGLLDASFSLPPRTIPSARASLPKPTATKPAQRLSRAA